MGLINKVIEVKNMALVESDKIDFIKEKLTITSTGISDHFTLNLFKEHEDENKIYVPRILVSKYGKKIEPDKRMFLEDDWETNIVLRPKQKPLTDKYLKSIEKESPYGGIIEAKTATGKTVCGIYIASKLKYTPKLRTLIIVPTKTLFKQWHKEILKHTNCKEEDIGIIVQNKCDVKGKKFVIGMLHSLAMREYPDIYNDFGFIIIDEVHKIGSEVLSQAIFKFNSLHTLGLSATPDRKDGMERVFFYCLGIIVAKSTEQVAIPTIYILPYTGLDANHEGCFGKWGKFKDKFISSKYLNKLELSKPRIELLTNIISRLYKSGHNTLALSDRISILENIKKCLITFGFKEEDIGLVCGNKEEKGRRIELATYGTAGIGYDRADLTALVLCTPRADVRQAIGRLRQDGVIIDIVDVESDKVRGWVYPRLKFYKSIKSKIINKLER